MSGHQGGSCSWLAFRQIAELKKHLVLVAFANSASYRKWPPALELLWDPWWHGVYVMEKRGCMEYF